MLSSLPMDRGQGLWFHKMPSGGRGEYEVTGAQGEITASSLVGYDFALASDRLTVETGVYLGAQGGKRRIRIHDGSIGIQRQIAALLLLPQSTRDETRVSNARPIILEKRYIMDASFDIVELEHGRAICVLKTVLARSGKIDEPSEQRAVDVPDRQARLHIIAERTHSLDEVIATAYREWYALASLAKISQATEAAAGKVMSLLAERELSYLPGSDPLAVLERLSGAANTALDVPEPPEAPQDTPSIRLRSERIYRQQRARGASAVKFAKSVQAAYNFTCAFCGFYSPGRAGLMSSGVQAAHILPYGKYELDVVQNGIMLCGVHHWAFDNHVLLLSFDGERYRVAVEPERFELLRASAATEAALQSVAGEIDLNRLPKRPADWPNPDYIATLYQTSG